MKKWIAMIMAAVVCLSLFTACKKGEESAQTEVQEAVVAQPLLGEELEAAKAEVSGEWRSSEGDILMWIGFKEDVCTVNIDRKVGDDWEIWSFSGDLAKYDDYRLVADNCTKYLTTEENGTVSVYEDGAASITIKDGKLTWIDESEHAADDVVFEKSYN